MLKDKDYIDKVIYQLKVMTKVKSNRQLAMLLGLLPATFSNTIKRNLLPYEKIIQFASKNNISLDNIFLLQDKTLTKNISKENDDCPTTKINIINTNNFLNLPIKPHDNEILKAFVTDKKIYLFDVNDKKIEHSYLYLININSKYFAVKVILDFDGNYKIQDDCGNTMTVLNNLSSINNEGKIHYIFNKETLI